MKTDERSRPTRRPLATLAVAVLLAAALALAGLNSLGAPFLLDDNSFIVNNPGIRTLQPPWRALSASAGGPGRPLVRLSFAINYACDGLNVRGYHATNLAIHLLAALALFGVVRRTLLLGRGIPEALARRATELAAAASLLWALHPLQTQAVTYIVQRAESLMGLFYLLTLYAVIRGAGSPEAAKRWHAAAVIACAAGMATKEVMITAPLVVLLYDRAFLSGSFREAWVSRRWLYPALACTWVVLILCLVASPPLRSAGFGMGSMTALSYAAVQPFVIVCVYLRLAFWPTGLVFDYGSALAPSTLQAVASAATLGALVILTALAWRRRPWLAFLGAWFFIILAPTSSFFPIADPAFEHRMYLPLAAIVVGATALAFLAGRRALIALSPGRATLAGWVLGGAAVVAASVLLGTLTHARNGDYADAVSLWQDTARKRPDNPRAHNNLGNALFVKGDFDGAIACYREAIRLKPDQPEQRVNLGNALRAANRLSEAEACYREALGLDEGLVDARISLARLLAATGRAGDAIRQYRRALEQSPADPWTLNSLAWLLATHPDGAARNGADAARFAEEACRLTGFAVPHLLDTLAAACAESGRWDEALRWERRAIDLASGTSEAPFAASLRLRLDSFEQHRPWRETPRP